MMIGGNERPSSPEEHAARRSLRLGAFAVLGIVLGGLAAIPTAAAPNYRAYSLFYDQFVRIELAPLLLVGVYTFALMLAVRADVHREHVDDPLIVGTPRREWFVALGLAVALVVWLGVRFVYHGFPFTDDENSAVVQSVIFAHGRTKVDVPLAWCPYIRSITPTDVGAWSCTWGPGFLPLFAAFRAPFVAMGVDVLCNVVMAVLSVFLVVAVARKLWPDRPDRAWIAAVFFATSTQMLFMAMTAFSMPMHLLTSLVWLWLYVDDRPPSLALLPWVGVLALGVHSPFPHAYFVLPFLFRYVLQRRFLLCAYVAPVYLLGISYWQGYVDRLGSAGAGAAALAKPSATAAYGISMFSFPTPQLLLAAAMHLALAITWSAPVVSPLFVAAIVRWRRLDAFTRDAATSVIVILVARVVFTHSPQGAGWGYRFLHDAIGVVALVAAVGVDSLVVALGAASAKRWILVSTAAVILLQLPLRAVGVERIIGPYRRGSEWLASLPYDVVVYPADYVMWGRQLVRNDPFFRKTPIIVDDDHLPRGFVDSLRAAGRSVKVLTPDELKAHGLPMRPFAIGRIELAR